LEGRVEAELRHVADALAELAESELRAMVVAANELVLMAAGLLSWMEHLADWELNRRSGTDLPLQPPGAAIPPEENADSIVAATMIRDGFAGRGETSDHMVALFEAIVGVLAGSATRR
jgi:hypothetical protein